LRRVKSLERAWDSSLGAMVMRFLGRLGMWEVLSVRLMSWVIGSRTVYLLGEASIYIGFL
jgi:hypothetical protein